MEGVVGEVVLHCFVAQLLADEEELRLRVRGLARLVLSCGLLGEPADGAREFPALEEVGEADVVGCCSGRPADVDVYGLEEVVEDFEAEFGREGHEVGGFGLGCSGGAFAGVEEGLDAEDVAVCAL